MYNKDARTPWYGSASPAGHKVDEALFRACLRPKPCKGASGAGESQEALDYYTPAMHQTAFILPRFIERDLAEVVSNAQTALGKQQVQNPAGTTSKQAAFEKDGPAGAVW
jgi:hypothetical protein